MFHRYRNILQKSNGHLKPNRKKFPVFGIPATLFQRSFPVGHTQKQAPVHWTQKENLFAEYEKNN